MICTWPAFGINTSRDISKLSLITYNNFEISLVVFMPHITTNHAITYTNTAERFLDYFEGEAVDCYGTTLLLTIDKPKRVFQCNSLTLIDNIFTINKVSEYITFQWKYCLRCLLCMINCLNELTIFVYSYFEKGCRKKCTFYQSKLFAESTIRLKTANLLCKSTLSYST